MNEKRIPIYYEYLTLNGNDIYHLLKVDSEGFSLLIPDNYNINYSKSVNDYSGIGHIYFSNEKSNFSIDYVKENLDSFQSYYEDNYEKKFVNYNGQKFYEINKDNIDYICMYMNNYHFKITGEHKLSINEYFDMYMILFSITFESIDNILHDIQVIKEYGISSYSKGEDILVLNLDKYLSDITIKTSITSDEEYLDYKAKEKKIELLSSNLISNITEDMLYFKYQDDKWILNGIFNFNILGNYNNGYITMYDEIINSEELKLIEKNNMLNLILMQKQNEISQYEDSIINSFCAYIIDYLNINMTYDTWDKYHIRDFIYLDKLSNDYESLSDKELYDIFKNKLSIELFNSKMIKDSTVGEELVIQPDRYVLTLSSMNYLLNSIKIVIDDEHKIL